MVGCSKQIRTEQPGKICYSVRSAKHEQNTGSADVGEKSPVGIGSHRTVLVGKAL